MKLFTPKQTKEAERQVLDELLRKEAAAANALKAKVAKLNALDSEFDSKIVAKRQELAELERQITRRTNGLDETIRVLEERRLSALQPITKEQNALDEARRQTEEALHKLVEERREIQKERESLNAKESRLHEQEKAVEKMQSDAISMLDRRQKGADAAVEAATLTMGLLKEEQLKTECLRQEVEKREESAKRAETLAKTAMLVADNRIAQEKAEQKKTDEKRKMLKVALEVLKKKELWLKQNGMGTK